MKHTYNITGMTCTGCQAKVQSLLEQIPGVKNADIDLVKAQAEIEMDRHVPTGTLQAALRDYPKYQLSETHYPADMPPLNEEEPKTWFQTYKPILLIFGYILTVSTIIANTSGGFDIMLFMRVFMGGFFLTFSFFKMLDLEGFADSYATYDIIAKRFRPWGFMYAFIELGLGLAFAVNFQPVILNWVTFVVMTISITGVLKSVLDKRKIRCACLGAVFNLPMSTVTIIEDALMIVMSAIMLFSHYAY